ncbi:C4-dicarboxylate ABC transporter [Reticulibacter mediterranei]|uniref:C4-dicarboxylate ABC transporter n=1 Tax=Reticulibacter mediterranei TaxID=2778369 RepID=A0A8J3IKB3_9CHLR|nr:hypothetical protein [Reticulibacter mediterranei]GHO91146.1 C4-dicarboxylate ABC transporter [Reticulibacter mediterranei]
MGERRNYHSTLPLVQKLLRRLRRFPYWLSVSIHNMNPSWFSCVMGTGILAICIVSSPLDLPWLENFAICLWITAVVLLAALLLLWGLQSVCYPARIQDSLRHFSHAQNWGTPPMACFTVASGFVLIGTQLIDPSLCMLYARILWLSGVAGSLFSAVAIPYFMFTHYELSAEHTYGNWLLPVAPLIGAAVPGSLLIPYWPDALHKEMLVLNYALLGTGMMLAAIVIVLFYSRLTYHNVPHGSFVPTFWIVIGSLGQSATATIALGNAARGHFLLLGDVLHKAGIAYGMLSWGFGIYWLVLAILVTLRAARKHLPFNLGWWSFIYPVGVMTTGTYSLHQHVPTQLFLIAGGALLLLLASLWALVTITTTRHLLHTVRNQTYVPHPL